MQTNPYPSELIAEIVAEFAIPTERVPKLESVLSLRLYFTPKGVAKLELGIAKGKKLHDKRESEKARDWARSRARLMRQKG